MADGTTVERFALTDKQSRELGSLSTAMEIRKIDEAKRQVDFVCSNEEVDSHGTIFRQSGWDFSRFDRNPIVLWAHDDREIPVGQSVSHRVVGKEMVATVQFATAAANPKAEHVWQSVLERTLRGISVGFRALEYHFERSEADGDEILVFDRQLLLELSVCPLPSNGGTLAKIRSLSPTPPTATGSTAPITPPERVAPLSQGNSAMSDELLSLKSKNLDLEAQARKLDADVFAHVATIRSLESKVAALEPEAKRAVELDSQVKVLNSQNERLVAERDAAQSRAVKAEDAVTASEVRALVGSKISAAEEADFIELRKSNPALFDRMVGQRKDMKLTEAVIPATDNATPPPAVDTRSASAATAADDWEAIERDAEAAD